VLLYQLYKAEVINEVRDGFCSEFESVDPLNERLHAYFAQLIIHRFTEKGATKAILSQLVCQQRVRAFTKYFTTLIQADHL